MLTVTNANRVNWGEMSLAQMARGNALDSYFTLKCYEVLYEKLDKLNMVRTYEEIMAPASLFLVDMEIDGLNISEQQLKVLQKELRDKIIEAEELLYSYPEVKKDSNMASANDMIRIFFSLDKFVGTEGQKDWLINPEWGFGLYPPVFTAKKQPSTSYEALDLLLTQIKDEIDRRGLHGKKK